MAVNAKTRSSHGEYVWRYTKACYLMDLLQTHELHLTRVDKFPQDSSDGLVPQKIQDEWNRIHREQIDKIAPGIDLGQFDIFNYTRRMCYASCWCNLQEESEYHWRNFAENGAAVCLRRDSLQRSLDKQTHGKVVCEDVKYADTSDLLLKDFGRELLSMHKTALFKGLRFSSEHEHRVLVLRDHYPDHSGSDKENSVRLAIKLNEIDGRIVTSAACNPRIRDEIHLEVKKQGLRFTVTQSAVK